MLDKCPQVAASSYTMEVCEHTSVGLGSSAQSRWPTDPHAEMPLEWACFA